MNITDEQMKQLRSLAKYLAGCYETLKKNLMKLFGAAKIVIDLQKKFRKWQQQIKQTRSGWHVNPDTRRNSQVLLNKPKYAVRKVIVC